MLKTIEGFYRDGQVQLTELPPDIQDSARVLITFLDSDQLNPSQIRQLIDRLETILGIQQGINEVNAGKARPLGDFVREMEQKYEISG